MLCSNPIVQEKGVKTGWNYPSPLHWRPWVRNPSLVVAVVVVAAAVAAAVRRRSTWR